MAPLSRDSILAVLAGLAAFGCDKSSTTATPEPPVAAASAPGAASASEVPAASGKPAEKEKGCAPGGCAPGKCGGGEK